MWGTTIRRRSLNVILLGAALVALVPSTGCQVDVGGQTLPSAHYLTDDIQYFPTGPEFKHAREAAAMEQRAAEEALRK